jgi:uncharacterized repeat protein (TIGR01451 family)
LFNVPVTVNYAGPDLSTSTKTVDKGTAIPGDTLMYTIDVINSSTAYTATGAMLTDTLPSGITFGGIVAGGATFSGGAVLWNGNVNPGVTQTIIFTATVNNGVPNGTVIANTADINNGLGNVVTAGPANTTVNSINLSASSKAVDKATASPGDTLQYTLVARNSGPTSAANATLVDTLPAHTTYQSPSVTGGAVAVPYLTAGAVLTGVNEVPPVTTTLGTGQINFTLNQATNLLTYQGQVSNLSSNVTGAHVHSGTVGVNGPVIWPLSYVTTTNGATFAGSVAVDPSLVPLLMAGLSQGALYANVHTTAKPNGEVRGQIGLTGGFTNIEWTGSLSAGGAQTVTYQAMVDKPLANGTHIVNNAQVGDGLGTTWWTNSVTTTINAADLSSSAKQATATNVKPGDVVTFTIFVRNTGDASTNAKMVDALPAGLTLVVTPTVTTGTVVFASNIVTWTGTLDFQYSNTQAEILVAAQVGTLGLCQQITNVAAISDSQGNTANPSVTLYGPCSKIYLPLIFKQ